MGQFPFEEVIAGAWADLSTHFWPGTLGDLCCAQCSPTVHIPITLATHQITLQSHVPTSLRLARQSL